MVSRLWSGREPAVGSAVSFGVSVGRNQRRREPRGGGVGEGRRKGRGGKRGKADTTETGQNGG